MAAQHVLQEVDQTYRQKITKAEQTIEQHTSLLKTLLAIYTISLSDTPLAEQLARALEAILHIPWIFNQSKGAIFLADEEKALLHLVSHKGLPPPLPEMCRQVAFGHCLCGQAAQLGGILHVSHVDERHSNTFAAITPHGHYVVPIQYHHRLLGVFTVYLEDGHPGLESEVELLQAIGNALAVLIYQKQHETRLLNDNQALEEQVRQHTEKLENNLSSLEQAHEQLLQSERMASLGEMVAGVTHEIKTPVGTAFTSATYLEEITSDFAALFDQGTLTKADLENYLHDVAELAKLINTNLNRAGSLIQSLKVVAVDQTNQQRRVFNLGSYLEEVLRSLQPHFKLTEHTVQLDCRSTIMLDNYPGAVSQIVTNLVINSLTHGFDKGQAGHIFLHISQNKGMIYWIYRDNGKGMDEETLRQIYQPFFTTRRGQGGSGLGMHIVHTLVNQKMGGTIECHSSPGQGVEFTIQLPRQQSVSGEQS